MTRTTAVVLALATVAQGVAVILLGRLDWRLALEVLAVTAALAGLVHQAWIHRLRLNHRIDMFLVMGVFGGLGMLAGWWVDLGFTAPPRDASFHAAMGHGCGGHDATDESPTSQVGKTMTMGADSCCEAETPTEPATAEDDCCDSDEVAAIPKEGGQSGHGGHGGHGGGSFWPMVFSWMTGLMLLGAIPPGLFLTRCAQLARSGWRRWVSTHLVGNALMVATMIWLGHAVGPMLAGWTGSAVLGGHLGMLGGMLVGMEAGMFGGEALLGLKPWREWTWGANSELDELNQASRH